MIETTLNLNGLEIPRIGLGTYELQGQRCRDAVAAALAAGYRHIDTAAEYGNEQEIGDALQASAVPRDRVFVTSKVWWDQLTREGVAISAAESLRRLRTDTLDLLLVHWPNSEVPLEDTLGAQPIYAPTPVIRGEVLRANPEIAGILNPIFISLDNVTLQTLNSRVEVDGENPTDVAREFLQENGFIS